MPALVTPFGTDGSVNESAIRELVAHHISKKVDGFYLCGTTGQGLYLSSTERKLVVETVIDQVDEKVPVIVHVGSVGLRKASDLASHAVAAGAAAISSIIPPTYTTLDGIAAYFQGLSEAAPQLPLLPYFMGAPTSPVTVMERLSFIPNLAGTKYTEPNMYEMTRIIEMGKDPWSVFSGMDEQCVFAAMCGADGAIGSSANIMPEGYRKIRLLVTEDKHREAYELQKRTNRIITTLISYGYPGALRAALSLMGFDCGDPRLPELPFDRSKLDQLGTDLEAAGFGELTSM